MSRQSRRVTEIGFDAIAIEGALIAPEIVAEIAATPSNAKSAADYGCPKGTTLGDEIVRYFRIGQAHWQAYSRIEQPTVTQTAAFARDLLRDAFAFADLNGPVEHSDGSRRYRIALEAKEGRVPVVCTAPVQDGDGFAKALPEFGDGEGGRARRSPVVLLQDWLNTNPDFYWGLVFAGDRVRLMRDNASLTRAAWIEADLGAMFRDEMFADFTAWWLLTHASRFGAAGAPASDCALERWREAGQQQGTAARERLREGVEAALQELGQGIVAANPEVRERIEAGTLGLQALFEELLRVVYRLIFLAVAEDRNLLHPANTPRKARDLYAGSYSFDHWRARSARRTAYDAHHDAWEGMKVTFAALETGQPLLGLPALGGLFGGGQTPTLREARIPNRHFLMAIYRLGFLEVDGQRARINWRDMKTEELGSVYESLLEIRPILRPSGEFVLDSGAKGNQRKTSGSYYTPDSLVETLLDSALDPVLDRAEAEGGAEAILDLKVIDPACGSGHFLLGAARRMADRVATLRDPDAPDRQAALRDVVNRCMHGVDRNPMAVELAKVALWIESVSPGQPLGFLDANIRCGDALLGVFDLAALEEGIPDEAYRPLTGDSKEAARYYGKRNKDAKKGQGQLDFAAGGGVTPPKLFATSLSTIKAMPQDTVAQVEAKKRRFEEWKADPASYRTQVACDLYVAAFLLPKTEVPASHQRGEVPTTADLRLKLAGANIYGPLEGAAVDAARAASALHWPLEFPDVMVARGGFDVVLGNPPWDVVQLSEEEYFESRAPEIAELKGAARKKAIAELETERPNLFSEFARDKRSFEAMNDFARASGRFDLSARGKVNTYGLFAEHFLHLTREGGRAGVIVPTGIATDANSAVFFGHLIDTERLAHVFDFENRERLFPSVDVRYKFCILSISSNNEYSSFAFFLTNTDQLDDERRRFDLTKEQIEGLNPVSKTAPVFRSRADADLMSAIAARVPIFLRDDHESSSGWGVEFRQGLFNKTLDGALFKDAKGGRFENDETGRLRIRLDGELLLPVGEGSQGFILDHRFASFRGGAYRELAAEERTPDCEVYPEFVMSPAAYADRLERKGFCDRGFWLGIRRVASSTNERTVVPALIPSGPATYGWLIAKEPDGRSAAILAANFASLVADYSMRVKLSQPSIPLETLYQLPILPPSAYSEADLAFIVPRVLELTYTSHSMAPFARDLGHEGPPFAWSEPRRAQLRAELDAWYALAYGLTGDDLRFVLDPKDVMGEDYPSETFRVLQKNEIAKYGEYRTRRLVLAAYDALEATAPDTGAVADGSWTYDIRDEPDVRLLLAAIVRRMRQPRPLPEVTLAFLYAAQPHLLMPHLSADRQAEWRRLVGNAATAGANVLSFASAHLGRFVEAKGRLAADCAWRFDRAAGTVDRGSAIYNILLPPSAEGRADFVWHAMRSIVVDSAASALSQEEQNFLAHAAAA